MDRSEVKAIVDREIEPLMEMMGVPHWRIKVEYERPENGEWEAECHRIPPYNRANVRIDPDSMADADHVIRTLVHELAHVVLSPFDVYRNVMTAHDVEGSPEDKRERQLWTYAVEQAVINVERMYRGMKAGRGGRAKPKPKPNRKAK
jgi:hypothetical protein